MEQIPCSNNELFDIALQLIMKASSIVSKRETCDEIGIQKGERDYVTQVDLQVESVVRDYLAERTPEIPFFGEENGGGNPSKGACWVLDPIDGTVNFMRGNPLCAISLALMLEGRPIIGVIDFPFLIERFTAVRGHGAKLNGKAIHVSSRAVAEEAVISMGDFAVGEGSQSRVKVAQRLITELSTNVLRVRMLGSAAADLAWLAAGRLDASLTLSNNPWDVQAGVLLVEEAGGTVFDADGQSHSLEARYTLASNKALSEYILSTIRRAEGISK